MTAGEGEDSIVNFLVDHLAHPPGDVSMGEVVVEFALDRDLIGAGSIVSAKQLADNVLEVEVESERGEGLMLEFESDDPFRLVRLGIEDM